MKFPVEPFHMMGPGGAFYDMYELMPQLGFDLER
jgi:hypothetical protein